MAKLKSSVKASTLLEVIVAMVIILIVFSLAIGIYNNVLGSANSAKKEKVNTLMERTISTSINEKNWNDEEINQDSILLNKTVVPYEDYADMLLITITAAEHGRQIAELKQVVKKTAYEH